MVRFVLNLPFKCSVCSPTNTPGTIHIYKWNNNRNLTNTYTFRKFCRTTLHLSMDYLLPRLHTVYEARKHSYFVIIDNFIIHYAQFLSTGKQYAPIVPLLSIDGNCLY